MYSLATAAAACGVNRTTVLRAIKAGKISASRNEHSEWQIDPAELHRVYPAAATVASKEGSTDATTQNASADATLAIKVAMAEERLAELKTLLDDMRGQRDSWQKMAESVKLLLPAPNPTPTTSWWPWARRAG
jgi:hypothetical protein